jgi:WD40 repeat protein
MKLNVLITILTLSMSSWIAGSGSHAQQAPATSGQRPELVLQTGVTVPAAIVAFSRDNRLLASMSFYGGSIELWDTASGRELYTINLGERSAITSAMTSAFGFTPDGASLVSVSAGAIKFWDASAKKGLSINGGRVSCCIPER